MFLDCFESRMFKASRFIVCLQNKRCSQTHDSASAWNRWGAWRQFSQIFCTHIKILNQLKVHCWLCFVKGVIGNWFHCSFKNLGFWVPFHLAVLFHCESPSTQFQVQLWLFLCLKQNSLDCGLCGIKCIMAMMHIKWLLYLECVENRVFEATNRFRE